MCELQVLHKTYEFIGDDMLFDLILSTGIKNKTFKQAYDICPYRLKDKLTNQILYMLPFNLNVKIRFQKNLSTEYLEKIFCTIDQIHITKILEQC